MEDLKALVLLSSRLQRMPSKLSVRFFYTFSLCIITSFFAKACTMALTGMDERLKLERYSFSTMNIVSCFLIIQSQDRYAGLSGGGFRGGFRGGPRGLGGRGLRGGGLRGGGLRGGGYSQAGGRDFSDQDLYADYPGPDQQGSGGGGGGGGGGMRMGGYGGSGYGGGAGGGFVEGDPSQQIMVRNVCYSFLYFLFFAIPRFLTCLLLFPLFLAAMVYCQRRFGRTFRDNRPSRTCRDPL